jgi:hypothetical protein
VIKMDRLRAEGLVEAGQCDPGDLKPGQAVEIVVESPRAGRDDVTLPGKITYVSPVISVGASYEVWAEFDNVEGKSGWVIRPGLMATVIVKEGRTTKTKGKVSTRGLTPDGEGWILLPPLVQRDRDTREASWKWDGQTATFSASKPRAYVSFPVTVAGSYELQARVTITKAKETTLICLPIAGTRAVLLDMKGDRGNSESPTATVRLKGVRPEPQPQGNPSMNVGAEYALTCRVAVSPGAVGVEVLRDDQVLYQWSGPLSQVAERRMIRPASVELETAYYTSSKFTDLRLRMLAGEAAALFPRPATPAGRGETN